MGYVDVHVIPRQLSKQPGLLCQGTLMPRTGTLFHSGFLGKGEPKEISGWQPLAHSSSFFPHLLFLALFSLLFLLDCKFHSSWKGPKYNYWMCTEKDSIVEEKKTYRNKDTPLDSVKLNALGFSVCICIHNMHTCIHMCRGAI